ncbi:MBL fold metallo-hydrolase [Streptacidiphilus sp. NEAU-YB345]|uniref:MBL fold metallo-hydrolase n=1 Tax=Streptacidiphilus fuscans TaxID=2789292 RepID=A0A931B8Y6_9ACTN|nr:MBL fold metallo-hydrolase [Streptacidiphilus fuscans]
MEVVELLPGRLHQLNFRVGQGYVWRDEDGGVSLIDAGPVGSGAGIAAALRGLGAEPGDVRRLLLTHFHRDHAGAAAEVAAWGGVEILAHRLDAAVVRGETPVIPPDLSDAPEWEREFHANLPPMPDVPPVKAITDLDDGDTLAFGGGTRIVALPGHTPGSAAFHLPEHGVIFLGDTVANVEGHTMRGIFNVNRRQAGESLKRLPRLDSVDIACFGHGDAIVGGADVALQRVVDALSE